MLEPVAQKIISVSFPGLCGVFSGPSSRGNSSAFSIVPSVTPSCASERLEGNRFQIIPSLHLNDFGCVTVGNKENTFLTDEKWREEQTVIGKENPREKSLTKHETNWGESKDFFLFWQYEMAKLEVSPWRQQRGRSNHSDNINMHIRTISHHINMESSF